MTQKSLMEEWREILENVLSSGWGLDEYAQPQSEYNKVFDQALSSLAEAVKGRLKKKECDDHPYEEDPLSIVAHPFCKKCKENEIYNLSQDDIRKMLKGG